MGLGDNFKCVGRAFACAGTTGNAFNWWLVFRVFPHIVRGAGRNAGEAGGAAFFIQNNHTQLIKAQSVFWAGVDTGTALVANAQFKIVMALRVEGNTGFGRVVYFKKKFGAGGYACIAPDALIIVGLESFH